MTIPLPRHQSRSGDAGPRSAALGLLLLLLGARGAIAGGSFIQSTGKFRVNMGASVTSTAFASNPVLGRKIIVLAWSWASSSPTGSPLPTLTASDSAGNTYGVDAQVTGSVNGRTAATILSAPVTAAGASFQVTVTSANSSTVILAVAMEFTGLANLDQTGTGSGTSASPTVSTTSATTAAQEVVVSVANIATPGAIFSSLTPGGGCTDRAVELDNQTWEAGDAADNFVTAAGVQSTTWTSSPAATAWIAAIATYRARRVMIIN